MPLATVLDREVDKMICGRENSGSLLNDVCRL